MCSFTTTYISKRDKLKEKMKKKKKKKKKQR